MAISTTNQEYILAKKRADETLHRFFHSHHHASEISTRERTHSPDHDPLLSSSSTSSPQSRSRSRSLGGVDVDEDVNIDTSTCTDHDNDNVDEHTSNHHLDDFSFVSPALCSMSNDFFMNTLQESTPAVAVAMSALMAAKSHDHDASSSQSQMVVEDNHTANDTANMSPGVNTGIHIHTGTSIPSHSPSPSQTNSQTSSLALSLSSLHNSPAASVSSSFFTDSLNQHLQTIEEEYGIPTMMSISNPFQTSIRRYPMASKRATRKESNPDIQQTVLQLTNIIFQPTKSKTQTETQSPSPKQQFQKFGSSLPKKVCQHPFKRNDIVWVCRTCQADETCVLCHTCFMASSHTNHDVAFYHAQAGGCCDCGDPDAWDPDGFCPLHGKVVKVELEEGLEWRVKGVVDYCVDFLEGFADGVERGYRRANGDLDGNGHFANGDVYRDGKRKYGKSLSTGYSVDDGGGGVDGADYGDGNASDQENGTMSGTDNIDRRGDTNFRRSTSAPVERTRTSTATERSEATVMDASTQGQVQVQVQGEEHEHAQEHEHEHERAQNQNMSMEWEQEAEGNDNVASPESPFPESPRSPSRNTHTGTDTSISGADECKFDAAAASTSKSRLSSSGHSFGSVEMAHKEEVEKDNAMDINTFIGYVNGNDNDNHDGKHASASALAQEFDPEAASTSKSQSRAKQYAIPEHMTPAHHLGLLGSQQQGLFLLLHADDVHTLLDITTALRSLYYSYPNHHSERILDSTSHKIAHLFQPQLDIGDLIVWGTQELMDELGPVLSSCWKDGDATACTRFGALMLEKAKILTEVGMVVSIKTREELCREIRCSAVLYFLNLMADCCDPFCRLVSVGLGAKANDEECGKEDDGDTKMEKMKISANIDEHNVSSGSTLVSMLQNDLKLPRKISKSWHELLLTLLAVPNFKAALANAYVDTYSAVTREYAQGIGIFDKSSYTLSVQFLNRVTYVEDLIKERDLLGCLVRSLFATLSVARKTNKHSIDGSITRIGAPSRSAAWTINMIHDVIDDYLNPLGPRTTSAAWGFRREDRKETGQAISSRLNPVLDPLHSVLSHRRYGPCVGDLKCVLNVPGVARLFSSIPKNNVPASPLQKPCLLDAWVHTLSLLQNMDGQRWRRSEQGHVEQEPRDWVGAFNAGIAIGSLYERILSWEDDDGNIDTNLYRIFKKSHTFLSPIELTQYILTKGIDSWQSAEALSFTPTTNGPIPAYNCPVCLPMSTVSADNNAPMAIKALSVAQSQVWSFHLPLHRFVASCLREVSRRPYQQDDGQPGGIDVLLTSLKESEDARKLYRIYSGLLEYPIIILARNSQIRSELWLRNGKSMFDQVLNYGEPHFCKGLRDADLALIQFAFIGLSTLEQADLDAATNGEKHKHNAFTPAHLMNLLLHRFGVFDFAGFCSAATTYEDRYWEEVKKGHYPPEKQMDSETKTLPWSYSATDDPIRHKSMFEEFLYTLIILITELYAPPPVDSEDHKRQAKARLRREIVHRLASGPKAHSELAEVHHVLPMRDNTILSEEGKCVNPDDATGAALEAALVDIADCKSFQGKSDKWELQRWAWNEYDPAFFHLSLRQHQNASEYRPNGLDSKDRRITPMPYAPFPPAAHKTFLRLRRDVTSDACLVAMLYRALHVHCRDCLVDDHFLGKLDKGKQEAYSPEALSETILGRVIHLLTLGAYAWEAIYINGNWRDNGGGNSGSVFHGFQDIPKHEDWVEKVLLVKPAIIMSSDAYCTEQNTLQLLHKLVTNGGSENFKVQDKSIRSGAAWLCEYAMRHNKGASTLLGHDGNATQSKVMVDSFEVDKKRRSREAKERAMKKFKAKMAEFAKSIDLSSDSDHVDNDSKSSFQDLPPPRSPSNAGSVVMDSIDGDSRGTPKTSDTQTNYVDSPSGAAPEFPMLLKSLNVANETVVEPTPRLFRERPRCIICADDGAIPQNSDADLSATKPKKHILTLCGYIQPSTVARGCAGGVLSNTIDEGQHLVGTHVSLCGHAIHVACCESHLKDSGQDRYLDGKRADFRCPMCRGLSNCLIPFLDVGRGWAFGDSTEESQSGIAKTKTLHGFLDKSKWWAARNDSLFMWNGRCSFVPRDPNTDGDKSSNHRIKSFGKKDLCRAWSTVLWTPTYERGVVQSHSSTGVTVVWRRILDQVSDISYKADTKRIGEDILHLGEFRHYLIEKLAYNQANRSSSAFESIDWPSCVIPFPSHEKRQALSREKLMSKQFLLIQSLAYSCCSEILECTRLARESTSANLDTILAKFGVKRFVCNGRFIIMPTPSEGDGTQIFEGRIGKLRYFALAILVATSPLAREVVHLCMDLPVRLNALTLSDEDSTTKRAQIVYPILCSNILTRVVAAMCAACGQERARSEVMGAAQSVMTTLVPSLGHLADESTVQDCLNFIQLGFIAQILQVLLGVFQKELMNEDQSDEEWTSFEHKVVEIINQVLSTPRDSISAWERSCAILLQAIVLDQSSSPMEDTTRSSPPDGLLLFLKACQTAKFCCQDYIYNAGTILQILLPKSISLFQNIEGSKKESADEIDAFFRIFGVQDLETLIDSPLVIEVVGHWYEHARPKKNLTSLDSRLDCRRVFRVHDWPHLHPFGSPLSKVTKLPPGRLPLLQGTLLVDNSVEEKKKSIKSLPTSYTDLYATLSSMMPESELTAVCFVCGEVLNAGGKGECTKHSSICGGGCGIFFLLQECICLAIHKENAVYITSPYVDSHGETPQYRGRPLNMDKSRYDFLHGLWSGNLLRAHVIAERSKMPRHRLIANNFY